MQRILVSAPESWGGGKKNQGNEVTDSVCQKWGTLKESHFSTSKKHTSTLLRVQRKLILPLFSQISQLEISLDTLELIQLGCCWRENRKWGRLAELDHVQVFVKSCLLPVSVWLIC